jgi:hypothetical protein
MVASRPYSRNLDARHAKTASRFGQPDISLPRGILVVASLPTAQPVAVQSHISSSSLDIMRTGRNNWLASFCWRYSLLLCASFPAFTSAREAQTPSAPASTGSPYSRACSANPVLGQGAKAKGFKKSRHPLPPETLPACLEVKGQPIEIQEFLQAVVRELQWRIGENRASEDSWTFVRYLNDDELAKYSDTKVLTESVVFTSGKAAVTLHTTELKDGFARVQISIHIQAEGKSTDKMSPQLGTNWPLGSNGVLEQELLNALQMHYKHAE